MYFDSIIHATQYYRAPTPLPDEWENDIRRLSEYELDALQIRINWRWNEKREGEYDFSDIDRLFDLAEKNGRKVIVKFLLECAPQYVFDKYGGIIIGPKGEQIRGGSHGAFYGGWKPCFTNPNVRKRASLFVEEVVKRYKDRKSLILYNAWNEIRNKPVEECFCPHCRRAFGEYLKEKFGTVEKLNSFYGAAEESFESIALPSMPHGYWDTFEFKKFKGSYELFNYLKFVRDAVRKHDTTRPVMSHTGFCAAFQTHIGDVCDDFHVSRAVDFFGTSIPCLCNMDTEEKRLDFMMLNDYVRSLDKDYFLYEIYPGLGMFKDEYDTPFDMSFKLYSAISSGAKGLVYWQYRAERVGMENDCAGIMRADGSPRPVASAVADFGKELKRDMQYFVNAYPRRSDIAILFDFDSMLLSEIEDASGDNYSFAERSDALHYYQRSHTGMYRMLKKNGIAVDYVNTREPEKIVSYKVVYLPYYNMLDTKLAAALTDFVRGGGVVIADEGFGLREMNTWMQPYDVDFAAMKIRMKERRERRADLLIDGNPLRTAPFVTEYDTDGEVALTYTDGTAAAWTKEYGKGRVVLFGFGLGYTLYSDPSTNLSAYLADLICGADARRDVYDDPENSVYVRRIENGQYTTEFIFNCSESPYSRKIESGVISIGGTATHQNDSIVVPKHSTGYFVTKSIQK